MDIENSPPRVYDNKNDNEPTKIPSFPIVSHVILAEFDILKGPSLACQYPCDIGANHLHLAELMLPDGSHLRKEDWLILVLNQKAASDFRLSTLNTEPLQDKELEGSVSWVQAFMYSESTKDWSPLGPTGQFQLLEFGTGIFIIWDSKISHKIFEIDLSQSHFYTPEPDYFIIQNSHITLGREILLFHRVSPSCVAISAVLALSELQALIPLSEKEEGLLFNHLLKHCNFENTHFLGKGCPICLPPHTTKRRLLYLLNLVQTRRVFGVDRGAKVNAIAIISRYRWISVFKPLLLLALDEYLKNPGIKVLETLYKSINSIDISYIPILTTSEKYLLKFFTCKDIIRNKLDLIMKYISENLDSSCQNRTPRTSINEISPGETDIKNIIVAQSPSDTSKRTIAKETLPFSIKDGRYFDTTAYYNNIHVPIRIPLALFPEEFPEISVSKIVLTFAGSGSSMQSSSTSKFPKNKSSGSFRYHPHLESGANTTPLMLIINAILSGKRVVFLGDKRPAGEVADYVISAGYIASGGGMIIPGISDRLFPYTGLSNLDYVFSVPGYIVGATNPVFKEQTGWWDVLCNIVTGKVMVGEHLSASASSRSPLNTALLSVNSTGAPSQIFSKTYSISTTPTENKSSLNENLHSPSIQNNTKRSGSSQIINPPNFGYSGSISPDKSYASRFSMYLNDNALIPDLLAGISDHIDENTLRGRLEHYLKCFILATGAHEINTYNYTDIALKTEHIEHPSWGGNLPTLVEVIANEKPDVVVYNKNRLEGWRATREYLYYKKGYEIFLQNRAIKDVDLDHIIDILSEDAHRIKADDLVKLFMCLNDILNMTTYEQINEFLQIICSKSRHLLPIAYGLFHNRWEVRYSATKILQRIGSYQTGAEIISQFNPFIQIKLEHSIKTFDSIPIDSLAMAPVLHIPSLVNSDASVETNNPSTDCEDSESHSQFIPSRNDSLATTTNAPVSMTNPPRTASNYLSDFTHQPAAKSRSVSDLYMAYTPRLYESFMSASRSSYEKDEIMQALGDRRPRSGDENDVELSLDTEQGSISHNKGGGFTQAPSKEDQCLKILLPNDDQTIKPSTSDQSPVPPRRLDSLKGEQ